MASITVRPLQTIEQHNAAARQRWAEKKRAESMTGVQCPTCGHELTWGLAQMFGGEPPRCRADCQRCGFSDVLVKVP
jgi:hypothetical protein